MLAQRKTEARFTSLGCSLLVLADTDQESGFFRISSLIYGINNLVGGYSFTTSFVVNVLLT